jgi:4-hydroxybenzoate polyprenyltransferase
VSQRISALPRALRVSQWIKNLLVFVPLVVDHRLLDPPLFVAATTAFVAFCLAASGGYVLNDLLDLQADRAHQTKRRRPFAAGELQPRHGWLLLPLLIGGAVALGVFALPLDFVGLLLLYLAITIAYSTWLKRLAVLDVLLLAGLYTLRMLAGGAATGVTPSAWLLAFAMFLFLSLAFLKRYSEMREAGPAEPVNRRGYRAGDLAWLGSMGGASGYLSVLVLALYLNSEQVVTLYRRPTLLWLVCPLLLYWTGRLWFLANRGEIHEDPIVAAVNDRVSYVVGLFVAITMIAAL